MQEFEYSVRVPKERIAVLIGRKGEVKKKIEEETKTKLNIDSEEGDVTVKGKDAINLYTTREVIKAIARGFNPDIALTLLKSDYVLELINVNEFIKTKGNITRLKGRVIGTEGKSRKNIEDLSETNVSVYGKTIAIIGQADNIMLAKKAIEMLLRGSPHGNVYKWLERQRKELRKKQVLGEF